MHPGPQRVLSRRRSRNTVANVLRERALTRPHDLAYRFLQDGDAAEARITYAELEQRARSVAATMAPQPDSRATALLIYPPGLDFIAAWFGCVYASVLPVVLQPPHPARAHRFVERIAGIAHDAAPALALTTAGLQRTLQDAPLTPALRAARWLATDGDLAAQPFDELPRVSNGDIAFLQYTSGSTSEPRGVLVTHDNLMANLRAVVAGFTRPDARDSVCWLPPWHDMGLVGGILGPLMAGATATLIPPAAFIQRPLRWLTAISRFAAAVSGGPNFAYDLCTRKIKPDQRAGLDLSGWRCAFNGAEPIDAAVLYAFASHFAPCGFDSRALTPCYGLAESTVLVSSKPYFEPPRVTPMARAGLAAQRALPCAPGTKDAQLLVSSGRPHETVVIVDQATRAPAADGEIGEIWLCGPSVAAGYRNRPDDNTLSFAARLPDDPRSFFRTGDLGVMLAGELYVTGRVKDLIIQDGCNHYPQDIERTVLRCHPALAGAECAVVSVSVGARERVVVITAARLAATDASAVARAIRSAVAEDHGIAVHDVALVRVGTIPRTSSGKVRRHLCRDAWLADTLAREHL